MTQFLAMGGYGAYIWSAFGFTIVVLAGLLWQSIHFARKQSRLLAALRSQAPAGRVRRRTPKVTLRENDAGPRVGQQLPS